MWNWIKFWEQQTVDSIMNGFHKIVAQLESHANLHFGIVEQTETEIKALSWVVDDAKAEARKAVEVANKIKALIGA